MGAKRWRGDVLAALRADYEGATIRLMDLAEKHKTTENMIALLRKKHGWTPRGKGRKTVTPAPQKARSPHEIGRMREEWTCLDQIVQRTTVERDQLGQKIVFLESLTKKPQGEDC